MPLFISGSYFFVNPTQKRFEVSSNFTNYLELGAIGLTPYYLEAKITKDEFKISGKLLGASGEILCEIRDNFIATTTNCIKEMTANGYRIKNANKDTIFEIRAKGNICHLIGTIYSNSGEIVAKGDGATFVVLKGPAIIGKLNNSIGIRIE